MWATSSSLFSWSKNKMPEITAALFHLVDTWLVEPYNDLLMVLFLDLHFRCSSNYPCLWHDSAWHGESDLKNSKHSTFLVGEHIGEHSHCHTQYNPASCCSRYHLWHLCQLLKWNQNYEINFSVRATHNWQRTVKAAFKLSMHGRIPY